MLSFDFSMKSCYLLIWHLNALFIDDYLSNLMYVGFKHIFRQCFTKLCKLSSGRKVPVCKVAQLLHPIHPAKFTETTFMTSFLL